MNLTEAELVEVVLRHPAGLEVSVFGNLLARSLEDGRFSVSWGIAVTDEVLFDDASDAARFFVQRRAEMRLGADYEARGSARVASS